MKTERDAEENTRGGRGEDEDKEETKEERKEERKEGDRRRRKGVKELLHTTLLVLPFPSVGDPPGI